MRHVDHLRSKGQATHGTAHALKGPYLGQKPPGSTPAVFAPNVVSTEGGELNSVFSPDGHEFYFTRQRRAWVVREENGVWGRPQKLAVAGNYSAVDMFVAGDGARMYICSDRPLTGQEPKKDATSAWRLECARLSEAHEPRRDPELRQGRRLSYPDGQRRPLLLLPARRWRGRRHHRARLVEGRFARPEKGSPINSEVSDFDPYVAPDESYIIFASDRPGGLGNADLYISFRTKDGSWSEPRNMGAPVSSPYLDYAPMVSPDGKYLFFTSGRGGADDIYWVDARVIDAMRPPPELGTLPLPR
jgi:hypothetical protein